MGRFFIDSENDRLRDMDKELDDIYFADKMDFYALCEFLNKQELEKLNYKRRLKTLRHRIQKLLEVENV